MNCRKCGEIAISVVHLWANEVTFEYLHDKRPTGYRKRPCVLTTDHANAIKWSNEDAHDNPQAR